MKNKIMLLGLLGLMACQDKRTTDAIGSELVDPSQDAASSLLHYYSNGSSYALRDTEWSCTRTSTMGITWDISVIAFYDDATMFVNNQVYTYTENGSGYLQIPNGYTVENLAGDASHITFKWNQNNVNRSFWDCVKN